MSIFNRKQTVNLEDYCNFVYDNLIPNSSESENNIDSMFIDYLEKRINVGYSDIDKQNIISELRALQFELFSLVWTHKFISDVIVMRQNIFTKKYLIEKGMENIWQNMNDYNDMIGAATLDWLSNLAKINISFNYNMRKDLISKNIEAAQKLGITDDDIIKRVNNRTWSENAWRQNFVHQIVIPQIGKKLNIKREELNRQDVSFFSEIMNGSYSGSKKILENIKIKK